MIDNPTDPWAWAGLAGDLIDLIPFVTGVGEAVKALGVVGDVADKIDDVHDVARVMDNVDDAYDAAKAADNIGDTLDAGKSVSKMDLDAAPINGGCFVAGTLVHTEDGYENIEEIQVGDYVWAWEDRSGDVALKRVVETYVYEKTELIHVFAAGEEIVATTEHPFYSPVKGWTAAVDLRAGDILVLVNGEYVVVEKIQHELLETPVKVYNFQVDGYHTYYVGEFGVLVHNSCTMESPPKTLPSEGIKVSTDEALDMAENYLGPGYKEAGKNSGRFVSADKTRQVRMGDYDITGRHAKGSHINFELLAYDQIKAKMTVFDNRHVYILNIMEGKMRFAIDIYDYSRENGIRLRWEPGAEIECTECPGAV